MEWKVIPSAPDYKISENGDVQRWVKSTKPRAHNSLGRILKHKYLPAGYAQLGLTVYGKKSNHYVHRLVAETFIGSAPLGKTYVAHLDGNNKNNHHTNLLWCTQKENLSHALNEHDTFQRGERHYRTKLTEEVVKSIRLSTKRNCELARELNTSPTTIQCIRTRKTWKHVA